MATPRTWLFLLLVLLAAAPASAQQVIYSEDFDRSVAGWQLYGLWAIDGTPPSMPGGPAYSGSMSLNFNNGVDYRGLQRAACQSPSISAQASVDHVLRFRCNYRTETTGTAYDRRSVVIRVNNTTVATNQLSGSSSAPQGCRCAAMGTWHIHEMAIPVPAGGTTPPTFQVEFVFDSVDSYSNGYPGWFIDNIAVFATGAPRVFNALSRTTIDFRDLNIETRIAADRSVQVLRSQPNVRFSPVTGQATSAEWQALTQAVQSANLASIPANIPDPNVYIVRPTSFVLDVDSSIPANDNTISGHLGVYGQWSSQLGPVMTAIAAIQDRLLASTPAPAGDDHGNTPQTATDLDAASQQATPGAIDPAGDVDFFKLVDSAPIIMIYPPPQRTYTIQTSVAGAMDTVMDLYASDGTTLLASNDDASGLGLASRIVHTTSAGTVLYVKVRHYSASATGSYTIRATASSTTPGPNPGPQDDHGNTPAAATSLVVGAAATAGAIEVAGDVDYFSFSQAGSFVVQTAVVGGMDTVIDLYASDGTTLLATNDDAPGLGYASRIAHSGTVAAGYFVKVRHYGSTGTGSYTVAVSAAP